MEGRTKEFWKRLKLILKNLGVATEKAVKGLEESDKKMQEVMKKVGI